MFTQCALKGTMKKFGALLSALTTAAAVDAEALAALMQFGRNGDDPFNGTNPVGRPIPFEGQNSNSPEDSDIKRG